MSSRLRRYIAPPVLPDRDATLVASAIYVIGYYLAGVAAIWTVIAPFTTPDAWAGVGLTLLAVLLVYFSMALARSGRVQTAGSVLVFMVWIVSTLSVIYGGLESPAAGHLT